MSFFFTSFPKGCMAKDMWNYFSRYGKVANIYSVEEGLLREVFWFREVSTSGGC